MPSTYHAMLQECGMKGLQNSFMATKPTSVSPNTCEGTPNFALKIVQHAKGRYVSQLLDVTASNSCECGLSPQSTCV